MFTVPNLLEIDTYDVTEQRRHFDCFFAMDTSRLVERIAQMTDAFEALLQAPPAPEAWPEWVKRASALMVHYATLTRDLSNMAGLGIGRTLLYPCTQPQDTSAETIPNVILRTRWAPEVESLLCPATLATQLAFPSKSFPSNTYVKAATLLEEVADRMLAYSDQASAAVSPAMSSAPDLSESLSASLSLYYKGMLL